MRQIHTNLRSWRTRAMLSVLALGLALWARPAMGVTITDLATGVAAGVGIASDPVNANVYYVEFNGGTLKRIHIIPGCDTPVPTCAITTVASGFTHPEDVALDLDHGLAYVTTRDDVGTTGALWRVNLVSHAKSLVTFNLEAPQQIALDTPTNTAYVIGFDGGKLWKIDLTTGVKVAVMTGLGHPVGLAITADRTRAYVTEQAPAQLAEIDLALHTRIRNVVTGLTSPFYLSWTDLAQYALYLVQRDPANNVLRVDLPSSTTTPVITGLPFRPSGIAVNVMAGVAYVAADSRVVKVGLAELPMGEPVFLGVGHVPSTKISVDGYATTDPGYFYQVQDSPFGGTLNIFGNLSNFTALTATHYRVLVSYEGSAPTPLGLSWNTYYWNTVTSQFDLTPVSPVPGPALPLPGGPAYEIPADYPTHAERWYPSFLMMRWPSGSNGNGHYTFTVQIFKKTGSTWTDLTSSLTSGNSLTVLIDNSGFNADVVAIRQHKSTPPPNPPLSVCAIVTSGTSKFDVEVTAYDPNQHLLSYGVTALFGHNGSSSVASDSYAAHVNPARTWSGVINTWMPAAGWQATCNCAHTFYLDAWKRTIDGYNYLLEGTAHQSITIHIVPPEPSAMSTCP
jgi:hypothetical protein